MSISINDNVAANVTKLKNSTPFQSKVIKSVGRDKTATARLNLVAGTGVFSVNKHKSLGQYFNEVLSCINRVMSPLQEVNFATEQFDFKIRVNGGGYKGQADAIRLAISKAISKLDDKFRGILKAAGYLTTDKRKVERKKCGLRKARKSEQYSKR